MNVVRSPYIFLISKIYSIPKELYKKSHQKKMESGSTPPESEDPKEKDDGDQDDTPGESL